MQSTTHSNGLTIYIYTCIYLRAGMINGLINGYRKLIIDYKSVTSIMLIIP